MADSVVDIEICQRNDSSLPEAKVEVLVEQELRRLRRVDIDGRISTENTGNSPLAQHVASFTCSPRRRDEKDDEVFTGPSTRFRYFVYRLSLEEAAVETMESDSEELPVASHWILPAQELHGLWESLCYSSNIKENLLNYVETTMLFSERNVDPNVIAWNKVVLLHGPPGTGKTSLCKALAQKAAIRLGKHFSRAELVEINSHSLFSKWFSESGKLVMKLFNEVRQLLEDPHALVCILIDEVESLAHARKNATSGAEPSDAIRVVNALLTQLDQIRRYKNVLILTTSNVTEAIDLAFVDRADIKQFIGQPEPRAIYQIYASCWRELMRAKFLKSVETRPWSELHHFFAEEVKEERILVLRDLIYKSVGLSGRTLRKIPFLAHALFLAKPEDDDFEQFLRAMLSAVEKQRADDKKLL